MKHMVRNVVSAGAMSVLLFYLLSMVIPGEWTVVLLALFALPGIIIGAAVTILEAIKERDDGEKKE